MLKKIIFCIIFFVPLLLPASDSKLIKDMDDKMVQVPVSPQRIACMHGVATGHIISLGRGSSIVMSMKPSPWVAKIYPETKNIEIISPPFTGNVEKMLRLKVDLVLYSPFPGEAEKYRAAGISSACSFSANKRARSMKEFIENFKRQYLFFGELLGGEAEEMAKNYCAYFDSKMSAILAKTSAIKEKDRPTVYYGGRAGGGLLSGQGKSSVLHWFVHTAGGNYLPQAIDGNFIDVNMEKLISWDPDIFLVGGWANTEGLKEPVLASMRAVKNGRVYRIPQGLFMWELASGESVLLAIYLAKIFHPELFKDWDMINEMTEFYSKVYKKKVGAADAERILKCLPPL